GALADLGRADREGDQDRSEGAQGLDAGQVAQHQNHQHADRDHDHHLIDLLCLQRQAVQGVFQQRRGGGLGGHAGQAQRVHFAVVDGEADVAGAAAFQLQQRQVTGPPDQTVVGDALLACLRVEVQPALAVVTAQPEFRLLVGRGLQADGVHQLQRNAGVGQQHVDYPCLVQRRGLTVQQQTDVVIGDVVDPADGFADEGLDVGRVLAARVDQGVGGDLLGAAQLDRLARGGRPGLDRLGAVTLGQHHAVIKSLGAAGTAGGPGNPAVAVLLVDADAVVIGNETLVEADEFLIERWNEQLRLYRNPAVGAEFHLRVQAPYIVGFVFPDGDVQDIEDRKS